MLPVGRRPSARHRDANELRAAAESRHARFRVRSRDLLDDRPLPALALERDAVPDRQLRVDAERAAAERDGPAVASRVYRGLDRREVARACRVVARRKRAFRIDVRLGFGCRAAAGPGNDDVLRLRRTGRGESRRVAASAVRRVRRRDDYRVDRSDGLVRRVRGIAGACRARSASRVARGPGIGRRAPGVGVRCRRIDNGIAAAGTAS